MEGCRVFPFTLPVRGSGHVSETYPRNSVFLFKSGTAILGSNSPQSNKS